MAFRLGDYAIFGQLWNKRPYSTHGYIVLQGEAEGEETVLRLELAGDCGPDLRGKCFRFTRDPGGEPASVFRVEDHPGFRDQQIGPTGTMTAQGWVRSMPCSVEEFMRRVDLGETPPTPWVRHLYLEWYGQNGRMLIEMAGPLVEECVREAKGEDDEGDWAPLPHLGLPPDYAVSSQPPPGPSFTIVRVEDDKVSTEHWTPRPKPPRSEPNDDSIPDALQRELDREASAIDRAIRGENDVPDDETTRELELMDYCIDHSEQQPVGSLLGDVDKLPDPEDLDDEEVEVQLKLLLAEMALVGVALDVCEHFGPRDCYRLLKDTILKEPSAYMELVGSGWVQHVSTWEYCKECEAELEDDALDPEG